MLTGQLNENASRILDMVIHDLKYFYGINKTRKTRELQQKFQFFFYV